MLTAILFGENAGDILEELEQVNVDLAKGGVQSLGSSVPKNLHALFILR